MLAIAGENVSISYVFLAYDSKVAGVQLVGGWKVAGIVGREGGDASLLVNCWKGGGGDAGLLVMWFFWSLAG